MTSRSKLPTVAEVNAEPRACPKGRPALFDRIDAKRTNEKQLAAAKTAVWLRANHRCERCGVHVARRLDSIHAGHVHHQQMRSKGGGHDPANLLLLCPKCHAKAHHQRVK